MLLLLLQLLATATVALSATTVSSVTGCTVVDIPVASSGSGVRETVVGRSLDLGKFAGVEVAWWLRVVPRHADGNNSLGYVSIAAAPGTAGARTARPTAVMEDVEGLNEAGLAVSSNTMRTAKYQRANAEDVRVHFSQLTRWLLGRFASVNEAVQGVRGVRVVGADKESEAFLHWAIQDASGSSAVVEFVDGELVAVPNTVRVLTNDPSFHWHVVNLNNFAGVVSNRPLSDDLDLCVDTPHEGIVPRQVSHGANAAALPGGTTPAARFVRAFFVKQMALKATPPRSVRDAVVLAARVLDAVAIVRGSESPRRADEGFPYSQWHSLRLTKRRVLLFRAYDDGAWRRFTLRAADLRRGAKRKAVWLSSSRAGSSRGSTRASSSDDADESGDDLADFGVDESGKLSSSSSSSSSPLRDGGDRADAVVDDNEGPPLQAVA